MIRRYLQYENFRTLGIKDEVEPENAKLIINETDSDVHQTFGGLVTLIGLNNTGKSNAIKGLKKLKGSLDQNDEPDFLFDDNHSTNLYWVFQDREKDFKIKYDLNQGKYFVSWDVDTKGLTTKKLSDKEIEKLKNIKNEFKALSFKYEDKKQGFNNLDIIAQLENAPKKNPSEILTDKKHFIDEKKFLDIKSDLEEILKQKIVNHSKEYYTKIEKAVIEAAHNKYYYYQIDRNTMSGLANHMANVKNSISRSKSPTASSFNEMHENVKLLINNNPNPQEGYFYIKAEFLTKMERLMPNVEKIRTDSYTRAIKDVISRIYQKTRLYHTAFLKDLDATYIYETAETCIKDYNEKVDLLEQIVTKIEKDNIIHIDDLNKMNSLLEELIDEVYMSNEIKKISKDIDALIKTHKSMSSSDIKLQKYLEDNKDIKRRYLDLPNIIDYSQNTKFNNDDLEIKGVNSQNVYDKLNSSKFFSRILRLINVKPDEFRIAYEKSSFNRATLKELKKRVNKKLKKISSQFNKLYFQNKEDHYCFEFEIEEQRILFTIDDNELAISYDRQSTGFQWFFNFFFSTIAGNGIKDGDIVLLDEPATNLHPQSQIELRRLIKKFALDQNITFVISTHSPFLVDLNHLDELRITRKEGRATIIENKFTNFDEIDVSDPIQSALTIERFMMFNPKNNVVFVEGVTDYNYLIAFNQLFESNDLSFIPIQGLLDLSEEKIQSIAKKHRNPYVLIDSDHAGNKFKVLCEKHDNINIFSINEVDAKFNTIEDLFTDNDKDKYRISLEREDKLFYRSTNFKNKISEKSLEKNTIDNFKKLLNHLDLA